MVVEEDKIALLTEDLEDQEVVVQLAVFLLEALEHLVKEHQVLEMAVVVVLELQVVDITAVQVVIIPNMLL